MNTKIIYRSLLLASGFLLLSSCNRDDINYLYSEQVVNDGNRELRLLPEQATYSDPSAHYDPATNEITVLPGTEIVLPYIKRGDLPTLLGTVPGSWSHRIDQEKKLIYIQTPEIGKFIEELALNGRDLGTDVLGRGSALFTSRTVKGITFSQEIKLHIPDKLYVTSKLVGPEASLTPIAYFSGVPFAPTDLTAKKYQLEYHLRTAEAGQYRDETIAGTPEEILQRMQLQIQASFEKMHREERYQQIFFTNYLYDPDSLHVYKQNSDDGNSLYLLGVKTNSSGHVDELTGPALGLSGDASTRPVFVHTIPWNTYAQLRGTTIHHDGPTVFPSYLQRIAVGTDLEIKNPKKYFGLPQGEDFDAKRLTLYTGSSTIWQEEVQNLSLVGDRPVLACAKDCSRYDASKDLLTSSFAALPTLTGSNNGSLILEYTTRTGAKLYRILVKKNEEAFDDLLATLPGTRRSFVIDANSSLTEGHATLFPISLKEKATELRSSVVEVLSQTLDQQKVYFTRGY